MCEAPNNNMCVNALFGLVRTQFDPSASAPPKKKMEVSWLTLKVTKTLPVCMYETQQLWGR